MRGGGVYQVMVRWGDDVVGVYPFNPRRGFRVGRDACDFPIEVEPVVLGRGRDELVAGDFRFEVERVVDAIPRARSLDWRLIVAMGGAVMLHALLAWAGRRAALPPSDTVDVARLAAMRVYLDAANERRLENAPADDDDWTPPRGCGVARAKPEDCSRPPRGVRPHVMEWDRPRTQLPYGPTGCADFGDFFTCAEGCTAGPVTLNAALASRLVTEALGIPHGHVGRTGPSVRVDAVQVSGEMSREDAGRAIAAALPDALRCYTFGLPVDPDLEGSATATFDLDHDRGPAERVKVTGLFPFVGECAMRHVGWALIEALRENARASVDVTLTFTPP